MKALGCLFMHVQCYYLFLEKRCFIQWCTRVLFKFYNPNNKACCFLVNRLHLEEGKGIHVSKERTYTILFPFVLWTTIGITAKNSRSRKIKRRWGAFLRGEQLQTIGSTYYVSYTLCHIPPLLGEKPPLRSVLFWSNRTPSKYVLTW